jgi:hypothetical protein
MHTSPSRVRRRRRPEQSGCEATAGPDQERHVGASPRLISASQKAERSPQQQGAIHIKAVKAACPGFFRREGYCPVQERRLAMVRSTRLQRRLRFCSSQQVHPRSRVVGPVLWPQPSGVSAPGRRGRPTSAVPRRASPPEGENSWGRRGPPVAVVVDPLTEGVRGGMGIGRARPGVRTSSRARALLASKVMALIR